MDYSRTGPAGTGRYGDEGSIKLAENVGMTNEQIAAILNIQVNEWFEAKQKLIKTERIIISLLFLEVILIKEENIIILQLG